MAAKRLHEDSGPDSDQSDEKRIRGGPSLTSVIGDMLTVKFLENFCTTLEPMLREAVREGVEAGIRRIRFTKSPSFRIQALEPSTSRLVFSKNLSLPIFTGTKILDTESNPLQLLIVDTRGDDQNGHERIESHLLRVEIVVLDGDFPGGERESWSSVEFGSSIVRERTGKPRLLIGEVSVTMRGGAAVIGHLEFTDNSSWIRGRKFRLGARVVPGSHEGVRIREAVSEAFPVKDHRGELYKKHYPPTLEDEVWRLEKIRKDGPFHQRLASEKIETVQDFLKLSVVDPARLKNIHGPGMSDRKWEATMKHARTCTMGSKLYIYRGAQSIVTLNPISMVIKAEINGQTYATPQELSSIRGYLEELVRRAYANWDKLEAVDGAFTENPILTLGDQPMVAMEQYSNQEATTAMPIHQIGNLAETNMGVGYADEGCSHWQMSPPYNDMPFNHGGDQFYITQYSSSDKKSSAEPFPNGS